MATELAFGAPHQEALAYLEGKTRVTREAFDRLLPELRSRAFTITGIESFDAMQRVQDAIASLAGGAEAGRTWDEAKAAITSELTALGDGAERRADLLLRTHGFQAFQAANWNAAQADIDTTHLQYLATEDDKVRDAHLALNGLILPKDDPFWDTHLPPWEWGCRCRVRSINPDLLAEARERDATVAPDQRYVIEGPAADQLRTGTLQRDGRRYDVRPPRDKAPRSEGDTPYQWHPDNLRLPMDTIGQRYEPDVREAFEGWAKRTEIPDLGRTVWDWAQATPTDNPRGDVPWIFRPSHITDRIRELGRGAEEARRFARLISENLVIEGTEIVVMDEAGAEVARLPRRILG